jgi:hypothetical protein
LIGVDNTMNNKLNSNTLGRFRTQYVKLSTALRAQKNDDGTDKFTTEQIAERLLGRMTEDALSIGVTVKELADGISSLKTSQKSGPGPDALQKEYKMLFLLKARDLWRVLDTVRTGITIASEDFIKELTARYNDLVNLSTEYRAYTKVQQGNRSNWNIYHGIQINSAGIQNYFGGWGDGSAKLRDQFGTRTAPHANMELDPAKVEELLELVMTSTGHYLGGAPVPQPKSTGYEKDETELIGEPAESELQDNQEDSSGLPDTEREEYLGPEELD